MKQEDDQSFVDFPFPEVSEKKTAKGVGSEVIKKKLKHQMYKDVLFNQEQKHDKMKCIRSSEHQLYSFEINKISLSAFDNKRVILNDGFTTLAVGHYKINSDI